MLQIVSIVGSLRKRSVNGAVARAVAAVAPHDVSVTVHDVSELPFYHGDVEQAGAPESVQALHAAVGACDGLLLCSPEYNSSFPAVTKNVIDWLSRPPRAWETTPVTMISATAGGRAGLGVREHFSAIMQRQPVRLFDTFGIGHAGDKLDDAGELADESTLVDLARFVARFADFCREPVPPAS